MLQKKQFKYVLFFNFFLFSLISIDGWTQLAKTPLLDFATNIGIQEIYVKSISKTDAAGNVYTGGATKNGMGNYDVILVKTSPTGAILWTKVYAGLGNGDDALVNFVIDASLNVFVVGTVYTSAINKNDIVTIKYNSAGVQQWIQTYNAPANGTDVGADIVIGNNNIYVTGGVQTTNGYSDFATIKYNSAGVFQWVRTYDSVGLFDGAQKITYVNTGIGEITVAGGAQQALTTWKYAARKYDANGVVLSTVVSGGSASGVDEVHDITKDVAGNIYLTGSIVNIGTGNDMYTVKLSATDLSILWTAIYNSSGSQTDKSNSVTVDASNNVYITGYSQHATQGKNYTTIKYNSSGVQQWIQTYNGEANGDDEAAALLFDNNFVYVTGTSKINGNKDYYTICYTAAGVKSWAIGYNGTNNKDDIAAAIAIDNAKSIIVAGQSNISPTNNTYTTIKYLQKDVYNPKPTVAVKGKAGYIENRGQVLNTNLTPNTTIKYYCDQSYPATYIDDSKISYLFSSLDTAETDSLHRVDMQFNKGTGNAKVYPNGLRDTYYNYYMGYMTKNGERTLGYNSIVKFGVYTNTDVIFTQNSRGYRHYIVARSGAPTANFEMQYTGQTSLTVDALGNLKIATTLGTLKQPKAKAYTMNNTTGVLTLLGWQPTYVVTGGNKVSFTYGTWPAGSTLVLEIEKDNEDLDEYEPIGNLGWSTYVGGNALDVENAAKIDDAGFQYIAGFSQSVSYATSPGALQALNLGSSAAVWNKFDLVHQLVYGTFYGGSINNPSFSFTEAKDIDVIGQEGDADYAVYIVGITPTTNLFILDDIGADNDNSANGEDDGFIAKFVEEGEFVWSRYYGGSLDDAIICVDHDENDNIFFTGTTASLGATFPLQNPEGGAYYNNLNTTNGGLFLGKIDNNLQLVWSTFYGGSTNNDFVTDLKYDRNNDNFYIAGQTQSNNIPFGTNFYDNTFGGFQDAYITKFSSNGNLLWGTYFGGSLFEGDKVNLSLTNDNKLFLSAVTYSTDLSTLYNTAAWSDNSLAGLSDLFVVQFDLNTLEPVQATYFGESEYEFYADITSDGVGGFYLTGVTGSSSYTLVDNNGNFYQQLYQQDDCDIADEAFLVHFNSTFEKDWVTYYGGTNSCSGPALYPDQPLDIVVGSIDNNQFLYLVGACGDYTLSEEIENFPRVDFDGAYDVSFFRSEFAGPNFDGFISMFNISDIATNIETNQKTYDQEINVFPSPSNNEINITLPKGYFNNLSIEIYNLLGEKVGSHKNLFSGINTFTIKFLADGIYNFKVKNNAEILGSGKFVKQQ
jgi:Secretion system C-terminal sorting domain